LVFPASAQASYVTGEIYGATGGQTPLQRESGSEISNGGWTRMEGKGQPTSGISAFISVHPRFLQIFMPCGSRTLGVRICVLKFPGCSFAAGAAGGKGQDRVLKLRILL
jgi:hypothetical protein